jgi:transcriptional regulator with XRE-family HTH domain
MRSKFSHLDGPCPGLPPLQLLRAHYGLTQEELANFMGVPRATLSLDEKPSFRNGPRPVSTAAWLRLMPFMVAMPALDSVEIRPAYQPLPKVEVGDDELRQALRLRQMKCHVETSELQREQYRARVRQAQARLRLHTLPALLEAVPDSPLGKRQRVWLDWFEYDARYILDDTKAATQYALRELRLRVLAYEATQLAELLDAGAAGSAS